MWRFFCHPLRALRTWRSHRRDESLPSSPPAPGSLVLSDMSATSTSTSTSTINAPASTTDDAAWKTGDLTIVSGDGTRFKAKHEMVMIGSAVLRKIILMTDLLNTGTPLHLSEPATLIRAFLYLCIDALPNSYFVDGGKRLFGVSISDTTIIDFLHKYDCETPRRRLRRAAWSALKHLRNSGDVVLLLGGYLRDEELCIAALGSMLTVRGIDKLLDRHADIPRPYFVAIDETVNAMRAAERCGGRLWGVQLAATFREILVDRHGLFECHLDEPEGE